MAAAVNGFGVAPPVHPLDAMNWNDRIWTPDQAKLLQASGYDLTGQQVLAQVISPGRGVIVETLNNGQARWPGDTDGVTSRDHLVVPYRYPSGAHLSYAGSREFIQATMDEVSQKYMNGCIKWVDDTTTQAHNFYIEVHDDPNGGCVSQVGYNGGFGGANQYLNLNPGTGVETSGCLHKSVVSHEFLHAMGMNHEQERYDRDDHVEIHFDRIEAGKEHNFEKMPQAEWLNMGSAYDGQSVMHYSAYSFQTQAAEDAGLPTITNLAGTPVQWPRVDRMSSEDAFQLAKMYESFCGELPSRTCADGTKYLKNRACDGISDCADGSDETTAVCDEVCDSPSVWVSEQNCLDSKTWTGQYDAMTETLVDGYPYIIRVTINDPLMPQFGGDFINMGTSCEGFDQPSYNLPGTSYYIWPRQQGWQFGNENCSPYMNIHYPDYQNGGSNNFWEQTTPSLNWWSGSEWVTNTDMQFKVLPIGYQQKNVSHRVLYRQPNGEWIIANLGHGTGNSYALTLGSSNCPSGSFANDIKIDYEVGTAIDCWGTTDWPTTTPQGGTTPTTPSTPATTTPSTTTPSPSPTTTTGSTGTCPQNVIDFCANVCVEQAATYSECKCIDGQCNVCPVGMTFVSEDSGACTDIDECANGTHNCAQNETCINIQESFQCQGSTNEADCCQTMTISPNIPGQSGLQGDYDLVSGQTHNGKSVYTRTDGQFHISFNTQFNSWEVTAGQLAGQTGVYMWGELAGQDSCIMPTFQGLFNYWNGEAWVPAPSEDIYCKDNGVPDNSCPECLIPENTKCYGNQFSGDITRIVNGAEANEHSWPWIVSYGWNGGVACGGSIINDEWVLTAAHCCDPAGDDAFVMVGHHNTQDQSNIRLNVLETYMHEGYDGSADILNDICLLKVEKMTLTNTVDIVCLPQSGVHVQPDFTRGPTNDCYVGGWGALFSGGSTPAKLQSVNVNIYSDDYCRANANQATVNNFFGQGLEFCAGHIDGGKDSCQGDSGGPLVCIENGQPVQYGVVSWGIGCAGAGNPGVYATVANYIDWIDGILNPAPTTTTTTTITTTTTEKPTTTTAEQTTESTSTSTATETSTTSTEGSTTTTTTTTTTPPDPCPCTDDVNNAIFNGFTPSMDKFGQIKHQATGANSIGFAMAQTIHDANKNPGMPSGGHDGYLVLRKYGSCDASVLSLFEDDSVNWYVADLGCADCYTTHNTGYFKSDVSARKKTFTLGYSFTPHADDVNKQNQVDKYQLFVTGLQALGATEQQIFDCFAGAKPANMYGDALNEGCDYSKCVGEKILIW